MVKQDKKILVGILMGSESDLGIMREAEKVLKDFGVSCELSIASAHRTPKRVEEFVKAAEGKGITVIIVGAGMAAHLPGVVAANTTIPVIGVPIDSSSLSGMDSLLSIVQMPAGIPVATVSIGKAGAKNAALLAIEILALSDKGLGQKLKNYRSKMAKKVEEADKRLGERG